MRRWLWIVLLVVPQLLHASSKTGTSGAQFLKIGAGARPEALGESFVGVADDINAVYYNPSGLGFLSQPELTASRTQWFQGIDYDFGAFVYPTDFGAFALSAATLKVDDIQKRSSNETLQGTFKSLDEAYALSFAKLWGPLFSLGCTTRYIRQALDTSSANSWNGDIGILKKMGRVPLSFGLAVRHMGPQIRFEKQSDPQPMVVDAGVSGTLLNERFLLSADIKKPRDSNIQLGVGSEYRFILNRQMTLLGQVGYNSSVTSADTATGISVGGGLGIKQFNIDVAWLPMGILGNTFRYSLRMKF